MYSRRLKTFILIFIIFISICLIRLVQLQIFECNDSREKIDQIGLAPARSIPTLRGSILDRHGEAIATEQPKFYLSISYKLTRLLDDRFWESNALIRMQSKGVTKAQAMRYWKNRLSDDIDALNEILERIDSLPNTNKDAALAQIDKINDKLWKMREYFAWKRNMPRSKKFSEYKEKYSQTQRLIMEAEINDLAEMKNNWYELAELKEMSDQVAAQEEFAANPNVKINAKAIRVYPFKSAACQVIGWVNPKHSDKKLFEHDRFLSYKNGELSGYWGLEYILEPFLRGARGEIVQKKRSLKAEHTPRKFGTDVKISIDIKLQKAIESLITNPEKNKNYKLPTGAILIDVPSGEILAMVSTPTFDLNKMRSEFSKVAGNNNPNKPLESRALYRTYPPGSSIKPFIYIIGLEEGYVSRDEIISCPPVPEKNWPKCWLQRQWSCHDDQWRDDGGNIGENALRGSCNIYFTKLANRMKPRTLQKWLWDFGFGHRILQSPDFDLIDKNIDVSELKNRNLNESSGSIANKRLVKSPTSFDQIGPLYKSERKWFGMGQGNLYVNLLQVANAYATIARGGIYMTPVLYTNIAAPSTMEVRDLNLKKTTLDSLYRGLYAVVNKYHGTAYSTFKKANFKSIGITVYGKTGSTQKPENAWFSGFAKDTSGRSIAIAVVVEGGQHGSSDAAPIGRDILELCWEFGYLGNAEHKNNDNN